MPYQIFKECEAMDRICDKELIKELLAEFVQTQELNQEYYDKAIANKDFGNGKATFDNGWGMFTTMLDYKMTERGKHLQKIDRWYPSSQTCNVCGCVNEDVKNLSIRKWTCPYCGAEHDRDVNAAINIKKEGQRIIGSRSTEFTLVDRDSSNWLKQEEKLLTRL